MLLGDLIRSLGNESTATRKG